MTEGPAQAGKAPPRLRFRVAPPGGLEPPTHGLGNPSTLRGKCVRAWQFLETPSGATSPGDVVFSGEYSGHRIIGQRAGAYRDNEAICTAFPPAGTGYEGLRPPAARRAMVEGRSVGTPLAPSPTPPLERRAATRPGAVTPGRGGARGRGGCRAQRCGIRVPTACVCAPLPFVSRRAR